MVQEVKKKPPEDEEKVNDLTSRQMHKYVAIQPYILCLYYSIESNYFLIPFYDGFNYILPFADVQLLIVARNLN